MKKLCPLAFLLISLGTPLIAQTPPPPLRPAPVVSPEVKEDRRVTFRLKASNAKAVAVPEKRAEVMDAFRRELFEDALPLVESRYRVEKDVVQRGIVGLSMGVRWKSSTMK